MKASEMLLVLCLSLAFFLVSPLLVKAQEEPEEQSQTCAGCMLLPLIKVAQRIGNFARPMVASHYLETYRVKGLLVDNVTHEGHPRIWFGTSARPIRDDLCGVVLAPHDPSAYNGVANVRYFFEPDRYTYLPDAEKLFKVPPELVPLYTWRYRVSDEPKALDLEISLRDAGHTALADEVKAMYETGTIVLVAQLNRSMMHGYGLGVQPSDASQYELVCHRPPPQ